MKMPIYKQHSDRDQRISSAKLAIRTLVPLDLLLAHKKELLSVCIWKITEADGKEKVRYWTEGAISTPIKELQHEHVHERKELIKRLLSGEDIESVVSDAIACMVTKAEHKILGCSKSVGWSRYQESGIRVYDALESNWLSSSKLEPALGAEQM
jgi:hypothetical protein